MVVENKSGEDAAIAGATAAAVYGAEIIAESIEDNVQNFTRFLLLARPDRAASIRTTSNPQHRKTSIVFRVANKPGGLFRSLAAFALRDIDLTKIESRPIEGRPWEYSFYLDLIGDQHDSHVERALANLAELAESVRVLGSYGRSEA
jgi:prephenate dehydratase